MNTMNNSPFVYPQNPAAPIATNFLRDQADSVDVVERDATGTQRVIKIGSAIPIVFGKFANGSGGVWVNAPAARFGLQITNTSDGTSFSTGMVISDGKIGAIGIDDIYKGALALNALPSEDSIDTSISLITPAVVVNAYGFMPEEGFNYISGSFIVTPGTPGTPGTPEIPGETSIVQREFVIDEWNRTYLSDTVFFVGLFFSDAKSIDVVLKVEDDEGLGYPFEYQILVQNIVVLQSFGDTYGGGQRVTYDAGTNNSQWQVNFRQIIPTMAGRSDIFNISVEGKGFKDAVTTGPGTPATPGTPGTPDTFKSSGLPLYGGEGGSFEGMSCLAVKGQILDNDGTGEYKEQIRCLVRNGVEVKNVVTGITESSNNFMDLAYYLLKKNKISDELIDIEAFQQMHDYLNVNGLHYNGVVAASVNLREFFASVAPGLMLKFVQDSGRFSFKPVLPIQSDNTIKRGSASVAKTFENANILEGSYQKSFYNAKDRKPFCALVSWREQNNQKFSTVINTELRFDATTIDGPYETYDYLDFITDITHAELVGSYILSSRARITHAIKFSTFFDSTALPGEKLAGQLSPMDIIKVNLNTETNGVLAVSNQFYQIDKITEGSTGLLVIDAIHFPADETGASLIAADIYGERLIGIPGNPITNVIGILAVTPPVAYYSDGEVVTLVASYDGDVTDVTYQWFDPSGAIMAGETGATLTFTASPELDPSSYAGNYTLIATSATAVDSPKEVSVQVTYANYLAARGGEITYDGPFKIHTFLTDSEFIVDYVPQSENIEYLIVGSGGNGSPEGLDSWPTAYGGGGGGGGVLTGTQTVNAPETFQIQVGINAVYGVEKPASANSSLFGLTAYAGGEGSVRSQIIADGASGGGSGGDQTGLNVLKKGNAIYGSQGNNGSFGSRGVTSLNLKTSGGGGGAGGPGTAGISAISGVQGGNGGQGISSSITGTAVIYGSGGGGLANGTRTVDGVPVTVTAGVGGTGAGKAATVSYRQNPNNTLSINKQPAEPANPANYGAGGSGGDNNNRGINGVVVVRYRYQ